MRDIFSVVADTSDGVIAIDEDQHVVFCNNAAERIFKASESEIVGEHCFELVGGRDECGRLHCRRHCRVMAMAERDQTVPTYDVRAQVDDNHAVWLSVSTILIPPQWRHLSVLFHVVRDVSRQKQIERDVGQLLSCAQRLMLIQQEGESGSDLTACPSAVGLTNREKEVLCVLASGTSTTNTARELGISPATVRNHVQSILTKFGVHTRLEAVTLAMRNGVLREH